MRCERSCYLPDSAQATFFSHGLIDLSYTIGEDSPTERESLLPGVVSILTEISVSVTEILTHRIVDVSRENLGAYHTFYVGFNAFEAVAWFTFAFIVLLRWRRNRKTHLEIAYSILFVLFGLSDVMEIIAYPFWLLLAKAAVLAGLLLTRRHLIRVHYVGKKF